MDPEKCDFQKGMSPKSGNYKIESIDNGQALSVSINWVSLDNEAFYTQYRLVPNDAMQKLEDNEIADEIKATIVNSSTLCVTFYKQLLSVLKVTHEILPNGYMRVTQEGTDENGNNYQNTEIQKLKGVKVLVVNALREEPHHSHFNLKEALDFINLVQPETAYLTHISHLLGFHEEVQQRLPKNVYLAYDNLKITI